MSQRQRFSVHFYRANTHKKSITSTYKQTFSQLGIHPNRLQTFKLKNQVMLSAVGLNGRITAAEYIWLYDFVHAC